MHGVGLARGWVRSEVVGSDVGVGCGLVVGFVVELMVGW